MNQAFRTFLRKCQIILIITFGTVPVGLLLFSYTAQPLVPFAWVFPGLYLILALLALAVRGKWRLPYGIAMSGLLLLCTGLLTPSACLLPALIDGCFYAVVLLWSLRISGWTQEDELPVFWGCFCVVVHLAGQVILFANQNLNDPILEPSGPWMLVCFFLFAALTLLSMNRASLSGAAGKRQSISGLMRQKNTLMTLGLFLSALLICLIPAAIGAVKALASWIFTALQALFFFLMGKGAGYGGTGSAVTEPMDTSTTEELVQTSALAAIINLITLAVGAVLTLLLALYLLRSLYRKLKVLLPRLLAALNRFAAATTEDYVDEITDTRKLGETIRVPKRRSRRDRSPDLRKLPPNMQIRQRYQRLSQKHPEWASSATARENLPPSLSPLYERARYSSHPITEEEAAAFTAEAKHI